MQPELDDDHALRRERALEAGDLVVGAAPLLLGGEALDALDEDAAVPRPIEDGHPTPAGQRGAESVQEVVALLVEGGRGELRDPDVSGVHPADEPLDRSALAGRVPPLEEDQDRWAQAPVALQSTEAQAQREQALLGRLEALGLLRAAELLRQIEFVETTHGSILSGRGRNGQVPLSGAETRLRSRVFRERLCKTPQRLSLVCGNTVN